MTQPSGFQLPAYYKMSETGDWRPWEGGPVSERYLKGVGCSKINIQGYNMVAFKFIDGREWTCLHGWEPSTLPREGRAEGV